MFYLTINTYPNKFDTAYFGLLGIQFSYIQLVMSHRLPPFYLQPLIFTYFSQYFSIYINYKTINLLVDLHLHLSYIYPLASSIRFYLL